MKPLFFVGNRRSGTSMFTMILNEHHNIYMSLEADALWNIYTEGDLSLPPDDAAVHWSDAEVNAWQPRRITNARNYLPYSKLVGSVREKFFQDILYIKDHGVLGRQDPYPEKKNEDLLWVGEKKPGVSSDPVLRSWIQEHFADAKYIHMVRDPRHSIGSMAKLGWADGDIDFLTDYWIRLEQQALEVESRLFIKFEEASKDPWTSMLQVCQYLGLDHQAQNDEKDPHGQMVTKRGTILDNYTTTTDEWFDRVEITEGLKPFMERYEYAY